MRWGPFLTVAALLLAAPDPARAQLFFAAMSDSGLRVGPLTVRASVTREPGPTRVNVLFSVVRPRKDSTTQDLYLLWPGEVVGDSRLSARDPALARYVEAAGFDVIGEGRLPLRAQRLAADAGLATETVAGGAPYVTFVQSGGALGLSPPATWIRIPSTPKLTDPGWLMDLEIPSGSLVKPRAATLIEQLVLGRRYLLSVSFNEVRERPLFPMYFAHRDRVVRLADAPAELVVNFAESGHLKIDQVYPLNTIRRLSETLESTEVVSLFLDTSEGITPQQLSVQFGYFSRTQAVALLVIPMVLLGLGYAVGPVLGRVGAHVAQHLLARVHVGRWNAAPLEQESGVVLSREVLARIVPGRTTGDEVLQLCGADAEVYERFPSPGHRTLIYRGQRTRPRTRRLFGWLSAVHHWEVERHEVTIDLEGGVVRDVRADTRQSRVPAGEKP